MTDSPRRSPRAVSPLGWIALGASILASASSWLVLFGDSEVYQTLPFLNTGEGGIDVAGIGTAVGIGLNIGAGTLRGANRVIGIVGGLLLLAPAVTFVVYILASSR